MSDSDPGPGGDRRQQAEYAVERLYDAQDAIKDAQSALREADALAESGERRYDDAESRIDAMIKDIEGTQL